MTDSINARPAIVSPDEWRASHENFLRKEKDLTQARDELAALRRRLPMYKIESAYVFEGASGPASLLDLFEGRKTLLLYHFMFAPGVGGWPTAGCVGCSMFMDNIGQFSTVHLRARDVSLAVVSRAPRAQIDAYRTRMQWTAQWVSSANNRFNEDFGLSTEKGENHGLSVFLREGRDVYRTYFTTARGLEDVGGVWAFLDLTPYGRQEKWEDSPQGWPQSAPFQWWHRHDEYPS